MSFAAFSTPVLRKLLRRALLLNNKLLVTNITDELNLRNMQEVSCG